MKLIKINTDHYVIVDDSEIEQDDYITKLSNKEITKANDEWSGDTHEDWKKITHSTQPLYKNDFWVIRELKLSEVKELLGVVDMDEKSEKANGYAYYGRPNGEKYIAFGEGYKSGYNQALEDNKEKKYTEEDIRKAILMARVRIENISPKYSIDEIFQSLQPKTEWDVEFIDGKLKLL